jgi:hypothetical protein
MDITSLLVIVAVGAASWWASRHVDAWERDKWMVSMLYSIISIGCLILIGIINKRLYLLVFCFYMILCLNLKKLIASRQGHIWFALFVGISGVLPMAISDLLLE